MKFLVDENVPHDVLVLLRSRGHDADYVGESFAKSSPDALLLLVAELHGHVVITFDKDFKRLISQMPAGSRTAVRNRAGRISLRCTEPMAVSRLTDLMEEIEFLYAVSQRRGNRFIIQVSETGYTVIT